MNPLLLFFMLSQAPDKALPRSSVAELEKPLPSGRGSVPSANVSGVPDTEALIKQIAESGRVLALVRPLDDKIRLAPGAPPLLAFRYLEGRQRGRFGGLDLVLDDAGH